MRKTILAGALMAAVASSNAMAADLYTPEPAGYNWTGFYGGAIVGYGWEDMSWRNLYGTYSDGPDDIYTGDVLDLDADGGLAGVTVGYNWQSGNMVYGLEGDWAWSGISGQDTCFGNNPDSYTATCKSDMKWISTVAGRVGFTAGSNTLVYAKGGLAIANHDLNIGDYSGFEDPAYPTKSHTSVGWTLGGGVEHAVSEMITVKAEVNYSDFGTDKVKFKAPTEGLDCGCLADFGTKMSLDVVTVKAGLNIKF